jgi:preprotein translocase subunit SecG
MGLLVILAIVAWIIIVVVLITVDPTPGGGSPA